MFVPEQWDVEGLTGTLADIVAVDAPIADWLGEEMVDPELVARRVTELSDAQMAAKIAEIGGGTWGDVEKSILLQTLDHHWKEHLSTLDALRQVIHLRSYAQKTPINEYKQEGFALFERMLTAIREDVTRSLSHIHFTMAPPETLDGALPPMPDFITTHMDPLTGLDDSADRDAGTMGLVSTRLPPLQIARPDMPADLGEDPADWEGKVGRNAPCPCGSGRKYKHCHGQL